VRPAPPPARRSPALLAGAALAGVAIAIAAGLGLWRARQPAAPPPAPAAAEPAAAVAPAAEPAPADAAPEGPQDEYERVLAGAERKYAGGSFLAAIAEYRKAVALKPTSPALVGLARALYDANRPIEAQRELERAIAADRSYPPAWLLLGELRQGEGHAAEARTAYERYLLLQPTGDNARAVREILARQLR
jgi:tetratricopeptide (TPR) repeat protein